MRACADSDCCAHECSVRAFGNLREPRECLGCLARGPTGPDTDERMRATRDKVAEEHSRVKAKIAELGPLRERVTALESSIGLIIKSTIRSRKQPRSGPRSVCPVFLFLFLCNVRRPHTCDSIHPTSCDGNRLSAGPARLPNRESEKVPLHIRQFRPLYTRIISLLRAHPCFLSGLHYALFGRQGQHAWERQQRSLNESAERDAQAAPMEKLDDVEQFKELVLCVFGELSERRNEHLFLKTLCMILKREMNRPDDAGQAGGNRAKPLVYETLVASYFSSPHLIAQMKTYLNKPIQTLLDDTNKVSENKSTQLSRRCHRLLVWLQRCSPDVKACDPTQALVRFSAFQRP